MSTALATRNNIPTLIGLIGKGVLALALTVLVSTFWIFLGLLIAAPVLSAIYGNTPALDQASHAVFGALSAVNLLGWGYFFINKFLPSK